jgi:hypothetical protein
MQGFARTVVGLGLMACAPGSRWLWEIQALI